MYRGLIAGIFWGCFAGAVFAQENGGTPAKVLKPDPRVQETIRRLMAAPIDSQETFDREIEPLRDIPRDELIRQLLLWELDAKGTEEAMMPGILIMEQLEIPIQQIPNALADYLQTATPSQRKQMENWLGGVEGQDREGPPNFRPYVEVLRHRRTTGEPLPLGLIGHMYRVDPQEALFSMVQLYEPDPLQAKPLRWSDHTVQEVLWRQQWQFEVDAQILAAARNELDAMSRNHQWWVRLYVAEIVPRYPELDADGLVERLRQDEHALVREALDRNAGNRQ